MRVGLIADTHGLLRPEVAAAFEAVDHNVHAGDVGSPEVLEGLSAIAPVTTVFVKVPDVTVTSTPTSLVPARTTVAPNRSAPARFTARWLGSSKTAS